MSGTNGGFGAGRPKLTDAEVTTLTMEYRKGSTVTHLAARFEVTPAAVIYHLKRVDAGEITLGEAAELAKQVKAKRTGSAATVGPKSRHFYHHHKLAGVQLACTHAATRQLIGSIGCGQCWEDAIRVDERAACEVPL